MVTIDKDRFYLELALKEAEKALEENTYPVGAVIVDQEGEIISKGRNKVHTEKDTTAHAEIVAIQNAGSSMFEAKVNKKEFTLYSSLEPCLMCTGAILFAKIKRVVWLLDDEMGFGGYKKIKEANLFERKFNEVVMVAEPFPDLRERQIYLMNKWMENANHIANLRKSVTK